MKVSVIHNLYKKNPFVNETVRLNLLALELSGVEYQYILFNDNGDKEIKNDIKEFLSNKNVEYHYSKTNFGMRMCSGGWIGALPHVKGDLIHNTGQDDVMSSQFYELSVRFLDTHSDIYLIHTNCFKVNERLEVHSFGMNPEFKLNYADPISCFKFWFGIDEQLDQVTRANNNMMACGVIYRKDLHDLIGEPDLKEFTGAADFEYWSRILFNEYKCHYINQPLWLYRAPDISTENYSAGNEIIDGKPNRGGWQQEAIQKIQDKYFKLWEERKNGHN